MKVVLATICILGVLATQCNTLSSTDSELDDSEIMMDSTDTENKTTTSVVESKLSDDDDDDTSEENESCDGRLSSFVRTFDTSSVLPDDYEQVSETMHNVDIYRQINHINDTIALVQRMIDYGTKLKSNKDIESTILYATSVMMDRIFAAQISPQCQADLMNVMNGIKDQQLWAYKFPDSFGHVIPTGMLRGHISSFGEYDQCINIKSPLLDSGRHVYGQYCQVHFRSPFPPMSAYNSSFESIFLAHPFYTQLMDMAKINNFDIYLVPDLVNKMIEGVNAINNNIYHYGVCFPHTCTTDDIERLFNEFLYPITKIPMRVEKRLCSVHKELKQFRLDSQQKTAIITLLILASIVLLSSLYHFYLVHVVDQSKSNSIILLENNNHNGCCQDSELKYKNGLIINTTLPPKIDRSIQMNERKIWQQFILAFSAIGNTEKLLKVDNRYGVLDTIRLILTFFVYCLQAFDFTAGFSAQMLRSIADTVPGEMATHNAYWFSRTPGVWIDGFVFTLGIMLIFSQFNQLKRSQGHFSFMLYLWKRWYRLSIAMIGTFFILFIYPLTGDGPIWFINEQWLLPPCKNTGSIVSSFLYVSNWNAAMGNYQIKSTFPLCNPPTWFLSMSTQLYILAPIVFLPLYRYPRFGLGLLTTIIILSPFSTISPRWLLGHATYIEPYRFKSISDMIRAFTNYHTNPAQYVTSLTIGMLVGYFIKCRPNIKIAGGRPMEYLLWIVSFSSIVSIWVWHNSLIDMNKMIPEIQALGWFAISKVMLSLSLGYITYMCCTGRGGIVNRILSVRFLQPLAKLSYGIYLLRVPTIFHRITSVRHTYEMQYYQMFQNIIIDFMITSMLAFVLHLLFEAPSANIMKIFESDQLYNGSPKSNGKLNLTKSDENESVPPKSEPDSIDAVAVNVILPNDYANNK